MVRPRPAHRYSNTFILVAVTQGREIEKQSKESRANEREKDRREHRQRKKETGEKTVYFLFAHLPCQAMQDPTMEGSLHEHQQTQPPPAPTLTQQATKPCPPKTHAAMISARSPREDSDPDEDENPWGEALWDEYEKALQVEKHQRREAAWEACREAAEEMLEREVGQQVVYTNCVVRTYN